MEQIETRNLWDYTYLSQLSETIKLVAYNLKIVNSWELGVETCCPAYSGQTVLVSLELKLVVQLSGQMVLVNSKIF